jgi:hypothetical protein
VLKSHTALCLYRPFTLVDNSTQRDHNSFHTRNYYHTGIHPVSHQTKSSSVGSLQHIKNLPESIHTPRYLR